jgi:hypothetical protein
MGIADYSEYDGLGLAELVARGEVSPAELIEEAIERIAYRRSKPRFRQGPMMGQNHKAPGTFRFRGLGIGSGGGIRRFATRELCSLPPDLRVMRTNPGSEVSR